MKDSTLCFLLKKENGFVKEICIAMKLRGFGTGKYNGVGGKFDPDAGDETIEDTAKREAEEEAGVKLLEIKKVGVIEFEFLSNPGIGQRVHIYTSESWEGEPYNKTGEMEPAWVTVENIPYAQMWEDDEYWLPQILNGKVVTGKFSFDDNGLIKDTIEMNIYDGPELLENSETSSNL